MRPILVGAAFSLALVAPVAARAQSHEDLARADSLFNAAKALVDSGQYDDACAKFAESKRLAPGLGVTLYLADCYEHIGRSASAWTEFRAAEGLARQRSDKRADVARARAQALEPKLDRLTITLAPTVPRAGLQVLRDGAAVSPEEWGLAVPVDPGDHVVLVSSPGRPQRTFAAHVGPESPAATVRIDRLDEEPAPAPAAAPPVAPVEPARAVPDAAPPPDPGATRRWIGIGVGAAGIVGLGLGAVFGLSASSKLHDSNVGPCDASNHCDPNGLQLRKDAGSAATVSTIAFVLGGAAVAGGIVLYATAPSARGAGTVGLSVAPAVGGGSALLRGSF